MGLTTSQVGWAASSLAFTAIPGAITAGEVSDRYGRRMTLVAASVLFLTGALLMAFAQNYGVLLVGRLVTGLGVGTGLAIDPLYISEVSPPHLRGMLVSAAELSINFGIMAGSFMSWLLGEYVSDPDISWRLLLGLGAVAPTCIIVLSFTVLPETPRWLVEKGRPVDAEKVMQKLCRGDQAEVDATMADLHRALEDERAAGKSSWGDLILRPSPGSRLMLLVVVGAGAAQQASGVEAVVVFTPIILADKVGLSAEAVRSVYLALTAWKMVMVLLAAALLDRIAGRRPLMLLSCAGVALSHLATAVGFFLGSAAANVIGLAGFMTFFSVALGPVAWLLASEVLPTNVRAKGMMLACTANRLVAGMVMISFLQAEGQSDESGRAAAGFIGLGVLTTVSFFYVLALLPETKGRTLEEMGEYFERCAVKKAWWMDPLCCCWRATRAVRYDGGPEPCPEPGVVADRIELARNVSTSSSPKPAV